MYTEELAGLPDGCGIQDVTNVRNLLDYLPIIEPNAGGNPVRVASESADGVASNLLPKFENFSDQVKDGFKLIEKFKIKSVDMTEPKQMATFKALSGIATALWFKRESFSSWMKL